MPGHRYADRPTVAVEVLIDAGLAVVWRLVADIGLPARFSSEFQGADWLDGATGPAVGARFVGRNRHPAVGTWQTICTVTECVPESRLGYAVQNPDDPAATWLFTLTRVGGRTRLRQSATLGPGPSLLSLVIAERPAAEREIVAGRLAYLRADMTATLTGIKDLAESAR